MPRTTSTHSVAESIFATYVPHGKYGGFYQRDLTNVQGLLSSPNIPRTNCTAREIAKLARLEHKQHMKSLTEHLWFETPHRRDYLNITDKIASLVQKSGVQEGLCLVNAMQKQLLAFSARVQLRIRTPLH